MTNFWQELATKQLQTKTEIETYLIQKLGTPTNQLSSNCLTELTKKIASYYQTGTPRNYTIYTLLGSVSEILERKFREGKRLGQTYYILKVGKEQLQATQEEINPNKWTQIEKLAILNQELVFKYRKFYTNKQLLDYLPIENFENSPTYQPRKTREVPNGIELNKDSKR